MTACSSTTALPSQNVLRGLLKYEPDTGKLFWLPRITETHTRSPSGSLDVSRWNTRYANKEAFTTRDERGRLTGSLLGKECKAHRVIFKLVYDFEPHEIDHINGNPGDNRLANLRAVTHPENGKNCRRSSRNSSGVTGISWHATKQRWAARIRVDGELIWLGAHERFNDAVVARKAAEIKYGFHPNHGRGRILDRRPLLP